MSIPALGSGRFAGQQKALQKGGTASRRVQSPLEQPLRPGGHSTGEVMVLSAAGPGAALVLREAAEALALSTLPAGFRCSFAVGLVSQFDVASLSVVLLFCRWQEIGSHCQDTGTGCAVAVLMLCGENGKLRRCHELHRCHGLRRCHGLARQGRRSWARSACGGSGSVLLCAWAEQPRVAPGLGLLLPGRTGRKESSHPPRGGFPSCGALLGVKQTAVHQMHLVFCHTLHFVLFVLLGCMFCRGFTACSFQPRV